MSEYRHQTDLQKTTLIVGCPNADGSSEHLAITAEFTESQKGANDEAVETLLDKFPCCHCGRDLQWIRQDEPKEVIGGGAADD